MFPCISIFSTKYIVKKKLYAYHTQFSYSVGIHSIEYNKYIKIVNIYVL